MNVNTVPPPANAAVATPAAAEPHAPKPLRLYAHSPLFYWWPVWVVGFAMAALTYWSGAPTAVGDSTLRVHPSSNLGVFYFLTLFLVVLITSHSVRGPASVAAVLVLLLATTTLAYFGWWDEILGWFGDLKIHLNFGAYFWFSALVFLTWAASVFVFDRLSYYEMTPGQVTHVSTIGLGSKSYDTKGMVVAKRRSDLFRHMLLGLGAGDLRITTAGAERETIEIPNVLFVDARLAAVQKHIASEPTMSVGV